MRALLALIALLLPLSLPAADKPQVVTSFSILADLTRAVGGEHIALTNLVGPDEDAHVFEPSPEHVRTLLQADLIIANGLGFEPWLERLLASSEARGRRIDASQDVLPLWLEEDGEKVADPHVWQSLSNAEIYVRNITQALSQLDPAHADAYAANRDAYLTKLNALLKQANTRLASLPVSQRKVVTSHDAFGYLGQAWQLQFIAPQGLSTHDEPSAAEVAALIRQLRHEDVRAVFVENIRDPRLVRQIADEAGARVGGTLYSDALASQGPASTYLGMFQHNLDILLAALHQRRP
ncbi:periplasmic solute binding protein [Stutzerimonas stutzeri TS44]|nr:periplasmic solute binding protein [Stutzerimonas stutzeri TS44]